MVEFLVVDDTDVDIGLKFAAGDTVVHHITAVVREPEFFERPPKIHLTFAAECSSVDPAPLEGTDLAAQHLEHMPDGHTARHCMGIDDQVRGHARLRKRHILRRLNEPDNTFLAMSGCELIAHLWYPEVTGPDLHEARRVLALGDDDGIHDPTFVAPHCDGGITAFLNGDELTRGLFKEPWRGGLSYEHIFLADNRLGVDDTVVIQVRVVFGTMRSGDFFVRYLDPVNLTARVASFLSVVCPEEVRSSKAPIDRGLVDDQRIFYVEPLIGEDRNDKVLTRRPLI